LSQEVQPATIPNEAQLEHERVLAYRAEVKAGRDDAQDSYDKAIVTVSGAALGIAVGLLGTTGGKADPPFKWALVASWFFFGLSLVSTLVSFQTSAASFGKQLDQVDKGVALAVLRQQKPGGWWSAATGFLNKTSWISLLIGIVLVGMFVATNMGSMRLTK
jgi:hypothetical protein